MKDIKNAMKKEKVTTEKRSGYKGFNLDEDENYWIKFGALKKASVLASYGRDKEAKDKLVEACEIIKEQKAQHVNKMEAIRRRWQFKLGIEEGFELPENINIEKTHPNYILDADLKNSEQPGVSLATMRMYIEKTSPFMIEGYDKNMFLD